MVLMLLSPATARSPVFNAMFEHEMEESKKVSERYHALTYNKLMFGNSFIRLGLQ